MKDKFILGGYFIVIPSNREDYMDQTLVPEKLITVSNCICDIVPGTWALSWVKDREGDISRIKEILHINDDKFTFMEHWVSEEFDKGTFGWQYGFSEINVAREFAKKFLSKVQEYWMLAIGLTQSERELFLSAETPHENIGSNLVWATLSKGIEMDLSNMLGYDILGYKEGCGSFDSYLCNGLEKDIYAKLGIVPNQYGYYDEYEMALKASEYISSDEVHAEPNLWQPWAICKIDAVVKSKYNKRSGNND